VTKAAIYVRISDDREGRGLGVERQEADCRALAGRLGLQVTEIYSDNDLSASASARKTRRGYRRLLAMAAAGRFAVILAYSSSRLTRTPREFEDLIELAQQHGVRFVYDKSPSFDLNTADGQMMARILAAADAAEAERTGERIRRKLDERKAAGLPHGGAYRPYGWERDRMTIRESEATWIRWGVKQTLGGVPIRTQYRELNARGVTTSKGLPWAHVTWRDTLMTARHAGLMRDGQSKASWPAIITPEEYRAVMRVLTDPARVTTPGRAGRLHLLSGLAHCAVLVDGKPCGAPLRVGKSKSANCETYDAYRCQRGSHVARRRDHVDSFILAVIAKRLRRPDAADLLSAAGEGEAARARRAAAAEAARLRLLIDDAAAEHGRLGLPLSALAAYTVPMREQLAAAEAAAEPPRDRKAVLGGVLGASDPGTAFLALPTDRQRPIIDLLIEITVGKGPRGNVFRPDGIEVRWR
jgi:site-specific DNA recombinase